MVRNGSAVSKIQIAKYIRTDVWPHLRKKIKRKRSLKQCDIFLILLDAAKNVRKGALSIYTDKSLIN